MTNKHPLTDDIIRYDKKLGCQDLGTWIYTENDLRAAADWQLEQVIKWLKEKEFDQLDYDEIIYADDLRKAMRPVTQENRNV